MHHYKYRIASRSLCWHHLTDPLVKQNLLVRPVEQTYAQVKGFYLVWSGVKSLHPNAALVLEWLLAQES